MNILGVENGFKLSILMLLVACCIFQFKDSLEKYVDGKTATTLSRRIDSEGSYFPSVSICAANGYKIQNMDVANMTSYVFLGKTVLKWPKNESKVQDAWNKITHSLGELLVGLWIRHSGGKLSYCMLDQGENRLMCTKDSLSLEVLSVNTLRYGRCYTIQLNNLSFPKDNILYLFANSKQDQELVAFMHGRHQELELISDFWGVNPNFVPIGKSHQGKLSFAHVETHLTDKTQCNSKISEESYFQCARQSMAKLMLTTSPKWAIERYKNFPLNGTRCTVPMFTNILPRSDKIPYCTSIREANAAIAIGRAAQRGLQTRDIKGCGKPCIASHYRFSEYTYSINPEFDEGILYLPSNYNYKYAPDHINSGFLYLSRVDGFVTVEKEVLLFDFNTIVGSVGGSLGLFIGFSFLQLSNQVIGHIFRYLYFQFTA